MFELYTCRTEVELVVGVGKAGKVVFVGPGEVIAIIEVGGAGNDQGWGGVVGGGIPGCPGAGILGLGGADQRRCYCQNGKQEISKHRGIILVKWR